MTTVVSSPKFVQPSIARPLAFRSRPLALLAVVAGTLASAAVAQDIRGDARRSGAPADRTAATQNVQDRMMGQLRDRLGVTNDDEWAIISDRVLKVVEARRNTGGTIAGLGAFALANRPGATDNSRAGASRHGGNPETALLQSALTDNLPDAELKARLERLREVRKENEEKLTRAQEDLRAVLTLKQEAMLVLAGLLP